MNEGEICKKNARGTDGPHKGGDRLEVVQSRRAEDIDEKTIRIEVHLIVEVRRVWKILDNDVAGHANLERNR